MDVVYPTPGIYTTTLATSAVRGLFSTSPSLHPALVSVPPSALRHSQPLVGVHQVSAGTGGGRSVSGTLVWYSLLSGWSVWWNPLWMELTQSSDPQSTGCFLQPPFLRPSWSCGCWTNLFQKGSWLSPNPRREMRRNGRNLLCSNKHLSRRVRGSDSLRFLRRH